MGKFNSYQEFLLAVRGHLNIDAKIAEMAKWKWKESDETDLDGYDGDLKYNVKTDTLSLRWETGGASGGNCWEGQPEAYYTDGLVPDFTPLDNLIELFSPGISMIKYRMLVGAVVELTTDSEREYYGNYRDFGVKLVSIKALWDALVELGLL